MVNSTGSSVSQIWDAYEQYKVYRKEIDNIDDHILKNQTRQKLKKVFLERIDFILTKNPPTLQECEELFSRIKNEKELEKILLKTKFYNEERRQAIEQSLEGLKVTQEYTSRSLDWESIKWYELCINFPWENYKYKCFIPSRTVERYDGNGIIKHFPEIKNMLYSNKEIAQLFEHIKKYMKNRGIEIDSNINYEEELRPEKQGSVYWFEALVYFKDIVTREWFPFKSDRRYKDSFCIRDWYSDSYVRVHIWPESYNISSGAPLKFLIMK